MRIWDQSGGSLAKAGRIKLGDPEEEEGEWMITRKLKMKEESS